MLQARALIELSYSHNPSSIFWVYYPQNPLTRRQYPFPQCELLRGLRVGRNDLPVEI